MTTARITLCCTLLVIVVVGAPAELAATSRSQSEIAVLRPFELSTPGDRRSAVRQTDEYRGNVRRRSEYGKPFQYGRSVSGPQGDITIWSPAPDNSYGKPPGPRFGPRQQQERAPRR